MFIKVISVKNINGVINMNINVLKYLKHTAENEDINFSSSLLQNYILGALKEFYQGTNKGESLPSALGELAFLYSKESINTDRITEFIEDMLNLITDSSQYIIEHIANFMDIVLVHNPQIINFYLYKLKKNKKVKDDNAAMLYSSVIYSALEHKVDLKDTFRHIEYPWRSYFKLANYYFYYKDNTSALNYIIKAVKTCPLELKCEYIKRRDYIVSNF